MQQTVELKWLETTGAGPAGTTWGVPWNEGTLSKEESFILKDEKGQVHPVQSWPLAFWPDGSVKWSAHAAVPDGKSTAFHLETGKKSLPQTPLKVTREDNAIAVDTGTLRCLIATEGTSVIHSITGGGKTMCSGGRLICVKERRKEDGAVSTTVKTRLYSKIFTAVIEQCGPVRGVIRLEGIHRAQNEENQWLPFTLRLYFYTGCSHIGITHTFVYDGDKNTDYLNGIGIEFDIPMEAPLYNRRVGFAGDTGLFYEASQLLQSWRPRIPHQIYQDQIDGKPLDLSPQANPEVFQILDNITKWNEYKLVQAAPDHYGISKRTKKECCWIDAVQGRRSHGFFFAGDTSGGLAVGVKDFWQKAPQSLQVADMLKQTAKMTVWLWSPDSKSMDFRDYDTQTHMLSYYEGFEEMRSTPYGIANTNEMTLWCFDSLPKKEALFDYAVRNTPLLVCTPQHYHDCKAFGVWGLTDRSTQKKKFVENQLDAAIEFYMSEIDRRGWYGFWNYGDVMHTYDSTRHCWRYDMGGFAWQNTELMPNMWLWYSFLRSGRADIFKMARAMTRHTSEVDVYHIGEYAGLGSRHNVLHWGCGCKEARISMAAHHRFYYYLTADERIGDILKQEKDADFALLHLDPMRAYYPKDKFPTHARTGPDWSAFCSNWMTMWERFGDNKYRDKICRGIECLKKMPLRLISGATFGYDPETGELSFFVEEPGSHLMICQGAPEIWMELNAMIKDPEWENMMAEFGRFYMLSREEKIRQSSLKIKGQGFSFAMFASSMAAFAAARENDTVLARKVWDILLKDTENRCMTLPVESERLPDQAYAAPVEEIPLISTNTTAQWSLNTVQCLELIGNQLEDDR